jgi:hypothetical protein
MDENLAWIHHINALIKQTSKNMGIIFRVKYILSDRPNALYCFYITLNQPYLD